MPAVGAVEGEREVDRLDERGAADDRIRDQGEDLLRHSLTGEPSD